MTDTAIAPAKTGEAPRAVSSTAERQPPGPRSAPDAVSAQDEPVQVAEAKPAGAPKRKGMSPVTRVVLIVIGLVVLAFAVVSGLNWWTHGRFVQGTNDAYLRADAVTVAPKVGGYVEQVFVSDNQAVKAGDPLAKIDTANYDAVVAQQEASLQARQADVATIQKQVETQQAQVATAQAQVARDKLNAAYAFGDAERYKTLSAQGVETRQRFDTARHTRDEAQAIAVTSQAQVATALRQVAAQKAQIAQAQAAVAAQAAAVKTARLNQGDTLLRASVAGRIGDKSVRVGQVVQPGQRLMSVVPTQDVYLVANFKETQIGHMKIGQRATVKIDALGGQTIKAVVDSFSPGTGSQFALLPPENATGNFTKIVQRVPVRFRLTAPESVRDHLLPGLSANVSVDTNQTSGQAVETRR